MPTGASVFHGSFLQFLDCEMVMWPELFLLKNTVTLKKFFPLKILFVSLKQLFSNK
jgi:hypothetical protein